MTRTEEEWTKSLQSDLYNLFSYICRHLQEGKPNFKASHLREHNTVGMTKWFHQIECKYTHTHTQISYN